MAFIGTPLDTRNTFQSLQGKRFNGDGSTTAFTLDVAPSSTLDIEVFVGNVRQDPNSAYTLSGTTLTFTGAPPSGTNNIYVVHQAKSVGTITPGANTVGVTELNLSDGTNGQAITTDGSGTLAFSTISGTTINNNADNRVITGSGTANTLNGESSLIFSGDALTFTYATNPAIDVIDSTNTVKARHQAGNTNAVFGSASNHPVVFIQGSGEVERMRIDNSGNLTFAKTSDSFGTSGITLYGESGSEGVGQFTGSDIVPMQLNRTSSDGYILSVYNDGSFEGGITFSGGTITYQTFVGSHWTRLADNSKPTILRGTVMESIATMCDWYEAVAEIEESTDSEGNVTPAHKVKECITLPNGKSEGDTVTFTSQGREYTGVYVKETNQQLPMSKISNTEDSKAVYGVFMGWDDQDNGLNGDVNDMNIASLGAYVVRIHKDETVAIGDYLQSKGDGTAKKQADDILRASTIAKVTSTEKTHEYADGSYCVPCTLHCG